MLFTAAHVIFSIPEEQQGAELSTSCPGLSRCAVAHKRLKMQ